MRFNFDVLTRFIIVAASMMSITSFAKHAKAQSDQPIAPSGIVVAKPHLGSNEIAQVFRSIGDLKAIRNADTVATRTPEEEASDDSVQPLIDQLGASEFSRREQATAQLHQLGSDAVPLLNQVASEHPDIEVRIRAKDIVSGISSGETAGRIDEFLSGKDVSLEGWSIFQTIVGDSTKVREIFVEMLLRHRDVLMSLDGTPKDRQAAMQAVQMRIQRGLSIEQRMPSNADAFASFLLANDPQIDLSLMDDAKLIQMTNMEAVNRLNIDPHLSGPFRAIVGGWVLRPRTDDRNEAILWVALSLGLPEALQLSLDTITPQAQPRSIAGAMQVIARFGSREQIETLRPFLDDPRPVTEPRFATDTIVEVQLGDVAAATIVLLSGKKLSDYGIDESATHPRFGVIIDELGFPTNDTAPRENSRAKVKLLIEEAPE